MSNKKEMIKEAKRVHESAMYSAQTQFEYSKTWRSVDRWLGGSASFVAAISGTAGLADIASAQVTGLIALIAAATGAIAVSLGAPKTKTLAHASANAYLALQQDCRVFIDIDAHRLPEQEARDELSSLVARLQELNATAEIPSKRAWARAKENVEKGSQEYEVDK